MISAGCVSQSSKEPGNPLGAAGEQSIADEFSAFVRSTGELVLCNRGMIGPRPNLLQLIATGGQGKTFSAGFSLVVTTALSPAKLARLDGRDSFCDSAFRRFQRRANAELRTKYDARLEQ
jgi:hypothetical protein